MHLRKIKKVIYIQFNAASDQKPVFFLEEEVGRILKDFSEKKWGHTLLKFLKFFFVFFRKKCTQNQTSHFGKAQMCCIKLIFRSFIKSETEKRTDVSFSRMMEQS